jgi:hypothetical protein
MRGAIEYPFTRYKRVEDGSGQRPGTSASGQHGAGVRSPDRHRASARLQRAYEKLSLVTSVKEKCFKNTDLELELVRAAS